MADTVVPIQEVPADTDFDEFVQFGLNLVSEGMPYLFVTLAELSEEEMKGHEEDLGIKLVMRVGNGLTPEALPRILANALESMIGYSG